MGQGQVDRSPPRARFTRLGVAAAYAFFAALWILLSDMAIDLWLEGHSEIVLASTVKGWAFVLVTALLLFALLRNLDRGAVDPAISAQIEREPYPWLLLAGLALAIVAATAGVVYQIVQKERQDRTRQLQTAGEVKAQQIAGWISERLADVRQLHLAKPLGRTYQRWRQGDAESRAIVIERLGQILELEGFTHGLLLDAAGHTLWMSEGVSHDLEPAARERLLAAVAEKGFGWLDPYRNGVGHTHMEFFATLAVPDGQAPPIVVLHTDDEYVLPPWVGAWPLPSATAEVVVFRREAQDIAYLNPLRHRSDAGMRLRFPADDATLLAAQIARSPEHAGVLLEGHDYRGKAVVGVGYAVSGTNWYLLAKMDRDEFYAGAFRDSLWVVLAGGFALVAVGVTLYVGRQRRQLAIAGAVQQAQAQHLRALQLLAAIADASADAIFAKDVDGRYLLFSRAAGAFTGRAEAEALGRDDTALFPAEQAAMLMANDRRVMAEDRVQTYEETIDTARGRRTFLALKGPLHGEGGQVIGMYGISRDITERNTAEEELRRSHEDLQRFNRAMVGREREMIRLKREINELAQALGRPAPYDLSAFADEPGVPDRPAGEGP